MLESELKKLILAKGIFLHGCTHATAKDEVSRCLAIHHFDFAVEMVLKSIAVKKNILTSSRRDLDFKKLWSKITEKGIDLPLRMRMFDLHDLRNLIQHAGTVPSLEDVTNFKGYVESFLEQVVKNEFSVAFDELSLACLIHNPKLKKLLQEAESLFKEGKYKECISMCDEALIRATFEIGDIFSKAGMLTGYFGASDELKKVLSKDYAEKYKGKEFYEAIKELSRAILQVGQASTGMQFLDEFRAKFLKFRELINALDRRTDEELKEDAQFSLDFVTTLLLKWQEEGVLSSDMM